MLEEKLSYSEAARQFEINDHGIIQRWERIYLEEGSEWLAIERRGRKSTGRPMKLQKEVEEDLIAKVPGFADLNSMLSNSVQSATESIPKFALPLKVRDFRVSFPLKQFSGTVMSPLKVTSLTLLPLNIGSEPSFAAREEPAGKTMGET